MEDSIVVNEEKEVKDSQKKRKKISFDIFIIPIEFLFSIICVIELFRYFTIKTYENYMPLKDLDFGILSGIVILGIIIYTLIKKRDNIGRLFLTFAIPLGIAYTLFILPLNVPDEGSHLLKANDMMYGNMFARKDNDGDYKVTATKELENYSYRRFLSYKDVYKEITKSTNYDETVKLISPLQVYSQFLYIGVALGLKIAQIFSLNIFIGIYIARMFNFIIFLIFGYLSIKKIPFGKRLLAIYLCMPMMIHQACSCSCDAVLNAVLIYYIVQIIYIVFKEKELTRKDKIILYVLTAFIAMFKFVYILVAGILFMILFNKKIDEKNRIVIILTTIIIGSMFTLGWYFISNQTKSVALETEKYNKMANIDAGKQMEYILNNKVEFVKIMFNEYIIYGPKYVAMAVGSELGWLEIKPNVSIIVLYLILLLYVTISEKSKYRFSWWSKLWILAIICVIFGLVSIAMYLNATSVGAERNGGVQGRYFTPIFFLVFLCLIRKDKELKIGNKDISIPISVAFTISEILNILTLICIFKFYLV